MNMWQRIGIVPPHFVTRRMQQSSYGMSFLWVAIFLIIYLWQTRQVSTLFQFLWTVPFQLALAALLMFALVGLTYTLLKGPFRQDVTFRNVFRAYGWSAIPWVVISISSVTLWNVFPLLKPVVEIIGTMVPLVVSFVWLTLWLIGQTTLSYRPIVSIILIPFFIVYLPIACIFLLLSI